MILLIFLDGLRPDQVTEQNTPNLLCLADRGVRFLNHHAVFPTETRVNVASFFTGCYPSRHGIVGNVFYLPNKETPQKVNTGEYGVVARFDDKTGGNALFAKSLGEILGDTGQRMASVGVGTSGNAFLHNHKACKTGGLVIHPQFTLPAHMEKELRRRLGPWPSVQVPNSARMDHATTILLEYIIPKYDPTVASLWLSEPDSAQHKTGISSPQAIEGIRQADVEVGRVMEYLEAKGLADSVDILVGSDHGHSTVTQTVNVEEELIEAGLKRGLNSADVFVAASGGSALIYVHNHEQARVKAIADFLMTQEWCGPMFALSSSSIQGSFPLSLTHSKDCRSPDILISLAWRNSQNVHGVKGTAVFAKGDVGVGCGNHGSMSPHEIRCVLVAAGPHFKKGLQDQIPSGNVDLFPIILHSLGLHPEVVDGRILSEALIGGPEPEDLFIDTSVYRSEARAGNNIFRQMLQISKVDQTIYLDKGKASML